VDECFTYDDVLRKNGHFYRRRSASRCSHCHHLCVGRAARYPMHKFRMTMTFAETAGNTTFTWLMRFESGAENEKLRSFIPAAIEENFDRLEAYLGRVSSNTRNT
jgi:hypothetical protein